MKKKITTIVSIVTLVAVMFGVTSPLTSTSKTTHHASFVPLPDRDLH